MGFIIDPYKFAVDAGVGSWKQLASANLAGGSSDTLDSGSFTTKKYLWIQGFITATGGTKRVYARLNAVTSNAYAMRSSTNGATDSTDTTQNQIQLDISGIGSTLPTFVNIFIVNDGSNEPLACYDSAYQGTAGAGTAPDTDDGVFKSDETTSITSVQFVNIAGSGDYGTASEIKVYGWDPTDEHTTDDNIWEELSSTNLSGGAATSLSSGTIATKKYLWIQYYGSFASGSGSNHSIQFNDDTGSNYSTRRSTDGAAYAAFINESDARVSGFSGTAPIFGNMYISNTSTNEKLILNKAVGQNTAGSGTAVRRYETVNKWSDTDQISEIDLISTTSSNMNTDTVMKVWGHD